MRFLLRTYALGAIALAWSVAPGAARAQTLDLKDTHVALDEAHTAGLLDDGTYGLYLTYMVHAPQKLPTQFRPMDLDQLGHTRCATPALLRAFQLRDAMNPAQRAQAQALGGRPVPCTGCTLCDNNTCVHYTVTSDGAYAQATLDFATQSWSTQMNTQAWFPPPADYGEGGGDELDIYLAPTNFGGAYTAPEFDVPDTNWNDATSYIVVDHNIPLSLMGTFVAHEMNHAVQFSYDFLESPNLFEATATFIEDKVFDSVNDYTFYMGDFQARPERSLDYVTYNDVYMYGAAAFMFFLSEAYDNDGPDIVRDLWENAKQPGNINEPDYYDSLDTVLQARGLGNIYDAYVQFSYWRTFTGSFANTADYYEEGNTWPAVSIIASHSLTSSAGLTTSNPPMEFGTNYALLNTSGGTTGDRFAVTFFGDTSRAWHVVLVGARTDGTTCVASASADASGNAAVFVDDLNDFAWAYLVFSNLGQPGVLRDPDDEFYGTTSFSYDIEYATNASDISTNGKTACGAPVTNGGDDDVGCNCNTTGPSNSLPGSASLVLGLSLLLIARRRSSVWAKPPEDL